MHLTASYKSKQFLALLIKLSIVIGCFYFIYVKFNHQDTFLFSNFLSSPVKNQLFSLQTGYLLVVFSFFNWFFEIKKWQLLTRKIQNISLLEATKQSLSSLTASLITPNRIGEYGTKALYYPKPFRKRIMLLNLLGNLFQLGATLLFGIIGFLYFFYRFPLPIEIENNKWLLILMLLLPILFWYLFAFKISIKGHSLNTLMKTTIKNSYHLKIKIGFLSILRYLIFSHQFYFLTQLFSVEMTYFETIFSIFTMYLLASIIPMLSLFDVVLKSSVAIWVFSYFGVNESIILLIVSIMWLCNVVLPSFIGSYFVLTFNTKNLTIKE